VRGFGYNEAEQRWELINTATNPAQATWDDDDGGTT
jgi:hypothetical protein